MSFPDACLPDATPPPTKPPWRETTGPNPHPRIGLPNPPRQCTCTTRESQIRLHAANTSAFSDQHPFSRSGRLTVAIELFGSDLFKLRGFGLHRPAAVSFGLQLNGRLTNARGVSRLRRAPCSFSRLMGYHIRVPSPEIPYVHCLPTTSCTQSRPVCVKLGKTGRIAEQRGRCADGGCRSLW